MSYHYVDPSRESEPHALPDVEVWEAETILVYCPRCRNSSDVPWLGDDEDHYCPACEQVAEWSADSDEQPKRGWFFAFGQPGCLYDSDVYGPFDTEADALDDAREYA